jgi:hypothetical protein
VADGVFASVRMAYLRRARMLFQRNRQFIIGEKQVPEQLAKRACEALL